MTKAQKEGMIKWQNDKKDSENLMIVYHKSLFFIGINLVSKKLCNKYLHQLHKNHSTNEQIIRIEREYTSKQLNLQS